jgi:hypothetical protein
MLYNRQGKSFKVEHLLVETGSRSSIDQQQNKRIRDLESQIRDENRGCDPRCRIHDKNKRIRDPGSAIKKDHPDSGSRIRNKNKRFQSLPFRVNSSCFQQNKLNPRQWCSELSVGFHRPEFVCSSLYRLAVVM